MAEGAPGDGTAHHVIVAGAVELRWVNRGGPGEPKWELQETGRAWFQLAPDRSEATLRPILEANIVPGATVWTDHHLSYLWLTAAGYRHFGVNHSESFTSPDGVTTNDIEACWARCKRLLRKQNARFPGEVGYDQV